MTAPRRAGAGIRDAQSPVRPPAYRSRVVSTADSRSDPLNVTVTLPARTGLLELLRRPARPAGDVAHVLHAHALASAESFTELLSLSTLAGVERHPYQLETVRRVLRVLRGRALLADEVGLGKTVEALMILREYQLRGMARRILVLAPPALVAHWAGELEQKSGIVARTTDAPASRQDPDAFWSDAAPGVTVASLALVRSARHASLVAAQSWDLVILDEAHRVKNRGTLGWKLVNGLKSRFLLLLTATPVENDLEEIYNLVTLLKPGQFATPAAFRREFVDSSDPTSPRNRERLRALLGEVMVRNTRAQSGLRLPPRYVTTMVIEPGAPERELYDRTLAFLRNHASEPSARMVAQTLLIEAGSSPAAVRGTLERMRDGDRHPHAGLAELAACAENVGVTRKVDALLELLAAHGDDQLLVFSRFRRTLDFLRDRMAVAGIRPVVFHGGLGGPEKQAALAAFRGGERVLLATDAGGEGHNLQFCHRLVNFDLPWNPMVIEQRIGRLHRFGQTSEVHVTNLCARGTIEERILDVLDRRVHLFELVVGEMDMVLGNLADEQDLEERVLSLYAGARTEAEIAAGFDAIADELLRARGVYEKARALDEALFGKDFET
jgi:SNF2 family DNA or RNA helicase